MPTFIATVSLTNFLDSFRTSLYSDNFLTYVLLAMIGEEGRGEERKGEEELTQELTENLETLT